MTDASPVNRYLLFERSDQLRSSDKVRYALQTDHVRCGERDDTHHPGLAANFTGIIGSAFEKEIDSHCLVRTLDEIKRALPGSDRLGPPATPSTNGTTFTASQSYFSSPDATHPLQFDAPAETDTQADFMDDCDDLDNKPWDKPGAQATYWNWPVETLYQNYHVVLAIDFGRLTFDVSTNGEVFADRIPSVVSALLDVVATTLEARDRDVANIASWLESNVADDSSRRRILKQVWSPHILVSFVLLNAPVSREKAKLFSLPKASKRKAPGRRTNRDAMHAHAEGAAEDPLTKPVPLFTPQETEFCEFEACGGSGKGDTVLCSGIPIVVRADARDILQDDTFVGRLQEVLLVYENVCRQRAAEAWPTSNLSSMLEYLVRASPEASAECQSIILTTNSRCLFCSETLCLLESAVRRKNIILSVVTLNRHFAIDSPMLSPLAQFLSSAGGFAVQIDYWLALAGQRLNSDWCHRFEGARCLAQQLFVQLINHFPVASFGASQRYQLTVEHSDRVSLYNAEKGFPDFVIGNSTLSLLRMIAAARFSEGWSVLLDYKDENTPAHLVARYQHSFQRGSLVLHYEMDVNRPVVYRRMLVSGTRALVEYFCSLRTDEQAALAFGEASGTWLSYLSVIRLALHGQARAEQAVLALLNAGPRSSLSTIELSPFSSAKGLAGVWMTLCDVAALAVFVRDESAAANIVSARHRLPAVGGHSGNSGGLSAAPLATTARALVRQRMALLRVRPLGLEDDLAFFHVDEAKGSAMYIVQFFPFSDSAQASGSSTRAGSDSGALSGASLAGQGTNETPVACGFECRVSFFLYNAEEQRAVLASIASTLMGTASASPGSCGSSAREEQHNTAVASSEARANVPHVVLQTSLSVDNAQALLLVSQTMSPRKLMLASYYTDGLWGGSGETPTVGNSGVSAEGVWQNSERQRSHGHTSDAAGGSLARPPLGKSKASATTASQQVLDVLRAFSKPFVPSHTVLAGARPYRFQLSCEEFFSGFVEEVFAFLVQRRVYVGQTPLVCYQGLLKAVAQWGTAGTRACGDCCKGVEMFDVIEGPNRTRDPTLSVTRFVMPGFCDGQPVQRTAAIADIAEDVHIATALYSYRVFADHSNAMGSGGNSGMGGYRDRWPATVEQRRTEGTTFVRAQIDSLLPYLQPSHAMLLDLRCPTALGVVGCRRLRERMNHLTASLADRHTVVSSDVLCPELRHLLGIRESCAGERSPKEQRVLASLLYPIRYSTLTFILVAERNCEDGQTNSTVNIVIAFLDAPLLHYGLMQRYQSNGGGPGKIKTDSRRPDQQCRTGALTRTLKLPDSTPDITVVSSVKHMLKSFASIYNAHQLISVMTMDVNSKQCTDARGKQLEELALLLGDLDTYTFEMEITHLLHAVDALQLGVSADNEAETCAGKLKALKSVLATLTLLDSCAFAPSPCAFFPSSLLSSGKCKDGGSRAKPSWVADSEGLETDSRHGGGSDEGPFRRTLPLIFASCVSLEVPKPGLAEAPRRCFWVSREHLDERVIQNFAACTQETKDAPPSETPDVCGEAHPDSAVSQNAPKPSPAQTTSLPSSSRMHLRIFARTIPPELIDLCRDPGYKPSVPIVRNVLRLLLYRYNPPELAGGVALTASNLSAAREEFARSADVSGPPLFVPNGAKTSFPLDCRKDDTSESDVDVLLRSCHDFSALPEAVERTVRDLVLQPLTEKIASYALYSSFFTQPFAMLQQTILCQTLTTTHGSTPPQRKDSSTTLLFTQPTLSACRKAALIPGLASLLREIVAPALMSCSVFRAQVFPVEFTQQATSYRSVDPKEAALDVFRRCVEEDHICVISAMREYGYVFVPNEAFFGKRWVLVQMNIQPTLPMNEARILFYDADVQPPSDEVRTPAAVSALLQGHIYSKITQISQLHLLKQLRDTQYASTELIPLHWGTQFSAGPATTHGGATAAPSSREHGTALETNDGCSTNFFLCGTDAVKIPIYYKLQNQCRKVLTRIATNSSRLELITIFNREQCFVVADDVEGDTFHYVRLVFVKDVGREVSPLSASPPISQTDRCPEMIVQLFTATTNASVGRPLRKLQDFCYFLAVQELQGHLNYVNKISFNDLVFLQNQPLAPIVVDLKKSFGNAVTKDDVQLALSLLFLNLRENKFKLFEFQDEEQTHTKSVFVKHYFAGAEGQQKTSDKSSTERVCTSQDAVDASPAQECAGETPAPASTVCRQKTMRFVKVVDGLTDVLCSCALRWAEDSDDPHAHVLFLDRFTTKVPSERYINGESERIIMAQLSDLVDDVLSQLSFHVQSRKHTENLPLSTVPGVMDSLLLTAQGICSVESSLLRYRLVSLDDVSPALFPTLVERLCGATKLFAPQCFCETSADQAPSIEVVPSFSWRWTERQQNDPMTDQKVVYITCGYGVQDEEEQRSVLDRDKAFVPRETRVLPYNLPELSVTATTMEEHQLGVLREQGLCPQGPVMRLRVIMRVSLLDGLSVVVFNLRDSDYLLRLIGRVVSEMQEKSSLLSNVLMQRLGYTVHSAFNEADLARNCCGDATNVLPGKSLSINGDAYRRRVNNVRFRPHRERTADDLSVIIEGLYNRGLIVNFIFPVEDAIATLYNESAEYSLADCERVVDEFLHTGVLVKEEKSALKPQIPLFKIVSGKDNARQSFNCRLNEVSGVPADALIACSYHRHILAAHIIVEAQNARSEVSEVLSVCDALWQDGPQNSVLELAKAVVTLQMKSKQVFGSRVPDFSLRREEWRPENDVLDATLPVYTQRGSPLSLATDRALRMYMRHLRQTYPSMCVIDLDPADPLTTGDEVLLNRLKCRYGKVTTESGDAHSFGTHLYYAVIPFADLVRGKNMRGRYGNLPSFLIPNEADEVHYTPITSAGLFVVEVGFQVVNYALDFFVVNGGRVPLSVSAKVAADFKQSLMFDGILYDSSVQHLHSRLRSHTPDVPGYVSVAASVAHLVKYYPSPPANSVHAAAVFYITDPRVLRLRSLPQSGDARGKGREFMLLVPERSAVSTIVRERTGEPYRFSGVIVWEKAQLYVLLSTEGDMGDCSRPPNDDLSLMVVQAKNLLLSQLLDSTQQERLDAAWDKFLCDRGSLGNATGRRTPTTPTSAKDLPSYDEFELLRNHCTRVVLRSYRMLLQSMMECVEWTGDDTLLVRTCQELFPECVLRVLKKSTREPIDSSTAPAAELSPLCPGEASPSFTLKSDSPVAGALPSREPLSSASSPQSPLGTALQDATAAVGGYNVESLFTSGIVQGGLILTLAANSSAGSAFLAVECSSSPDSVPTFTVEDASFLRRQSDLHSPLALVAVLTSEEELLLERFVILLSNALWSTIIPCSSQIMV